MAVKKGYPSKERDLRLTDQDVHVTAEPVREKQVASSVLAHMYVYVVGTDAVEASSTTILINATAHAAKIGDVIRFTSGALSGQEVKVQKVDTNSITLSETLASAPATAVTFEILRHKYPVVDSSGALSVSVGASALEFIRNGSATQVEEDTVTPANNRPLPVKLMGTAGDINITAGDLNVDLDHTLSSIKIGDGTDLLAVNSDGSINASISATNLDIRDLTHASDSVKIGDGTDFAEVTAANELKVLATAQPGVDIGDVTINNASIAVTGPLTDAELRATAVPVSGPLTDTELRATAVPVSATNLDIRDLVFASDKVDASGSSVSISGSVAVTDNAGSLTVDAVDLDIRDLSSVSDSVSAVQSGTWNINNIAGTVSLPTGAATETTLSTLNGKVPANLTVTSTRLLVDGSGVTQPVSGTVSATIDRLAVNGFVRNDYSSVNVTTSAYTTLVASTSATIKKLQIFDSSGQTLKLALGAAASEVDLLLVFPGGNGDVEVNIPAGTRISIRAVSATASVGEISVNLIG